MHFYKNLSCLHAYTLFFQYFIKMLVACFMLDQDVLLSWLRVEREIGS